MNEIGLSELLQLIIRDKGGTADQYNQLMDYIAFHETGPAQRMSASAQQKGGGPGRGRKPQGAPDRAEQGAKHRA